MTPFEVVGLGFLVLVLIIIYIACRIAQGD